jgi:hypothetical protein
MIRGVCEALVPLLAETLTAAGLGRWALAPGLAVSGQRFVFRMHGKQQPSGSAETPRNERKSGCLAGQLEATLGA